MSMTTTTSAVIQSMSPKMKYLGSFFIPCQLGTISFDRVLCDLEVSVSLIPLSARKMLGIWEMKPTNVSLQLADVSIKYPIRVLEDAYINVGNLYIPINFIIMDIKEDPQVPIIVRRHFLCIDDTIIDEKRGTLNM